MGSISQRMNALDHSMSHASQRSGKIGVKQQDFYNHEMEFKGFKAGTQQINKKHGEDDEAREMGNFGSNKGPVLAKQSNEPNGFDAMQDFDDLPSVKSRDMISQLDEVSDSSSL